MLNGYKTYIVGAIMVLVGAAELAGFDVVPSVDQSSALDYIMAGIAMFTLKSAIAKGEAK